MGYGNPSRASKEKGRGIVPRPFLFLPLFTEVPRSRCLGLHPLDQVRPPLGRLERLGVVAGLAPDLAVLELSKMATTLDTRPPS
jgi:hypothetical protein